MFLQEIGSAAIMAREEDLCKSVSCVCTCSWFFFYEGLFLVLVIGHVFKECTVQKGMT